MLEIIWLIIVGLIVLVYYAIAILNAIIGTAHINAGGIAIYDSKFTDAPETEKDGVEVLNDYPQEYEID